MITMMTEAAKAGVAAKAMLPRDTLPRGGRFGTHETF